MNDDVMCLKTDIHVNEAGVTDMVHFIVDGIISLMTQEKNTIKFKV